MPSNTIDLPFHAHVGNLEPIRQHCRRNGKKLRQVKPEPPPLPASAVPWFLQHGGPRTLDDAEALH